MLMMKPHDDDNKKETSERTTTTVSFSSQASLPWPNTSLTSSSGVTALKEDSSIQFLPPQQRAPANDLADFTINKLKRFDQLRLYGREKEVETIQQCWKNTTENDSVALLLISGIAGVGKSKLAYSLRETCQCGLFVEGKFDMTARNHPYSGWTAACAQVCAHILEWRNKGQEEQFVAMGQEIQSTLGKELSVLRQVVPALDDILQISEDELRESHEPSSPDQVKYRIEYACTRFLRIISNAFAPLCIMFEDLHWADVSTLELLTRFLSDDHIKQLTIVGTYRSNQADILLLNTLSELEMRSKSHESLVLAEIQVENLTVEAVHQLILDLLNISEGSARTLELARLCHKKTLGNSFHLQQFIFMLLEQGLLTFNLGLVKWVWDIGDIESKTGATSNVVDLLREKMFSLNEEQVQVLRLAACLGHSFSFQSLFTVWKDQSDQESKESPALTSILNVLEIEGFISRAVKGKKEIYHWTHDKIREAAHSLIKDDERTTIYGRVGGSLVRHMKQNDSTLTSLRFVAVDLLNKSGTNERDFNDSIRLARLNCEAARESLSLSAFRSAAEYAKVGISLLPHGRERWSIHKKLALELYSIGAQAESMGDFALMEEYCSIILKEKSIAEVDKLPIHHLLVERGVHRGTLEVSAALAEEILKQFGVCFPRSHMVVSLKLMKSIIDIKRSIKTIDPNNLRMMEGDKKMPYLMRIVDLLASCWYFLGDPRIPLALLRNFKWTQKYGITEISPVAFCNLGIIVAGFLNDIQAGSTFGSHALALLKKVDSRLAAPRTIFLVNGFLLHHTQPATSLLKSLLDGYDAGLRAGDTLNGFWCIFNFMMLKFFSGSGNLRLLHADFVKYSLQFKQLGADKIYADALSYIQAMFYLLDGKGKKGYLEFDPSNADESSCDKYIRLVLQGILLTYFGRHIESASICLEHGHDFIQKRHFTSLLTPISVYIQGLSSFIAYTQTKNKKLLKIGLIQMKKCENWASQGNPNVVHYEYLLKAEHARVKGDTNKAIKSYQSAMRKAGLAGFQNDAALINERMADFYLNVMNDHDEAKYRVGESLRYWRDWGAEAKARALEDAYKDLLGTPEQAPRTGQIH